MHAFEVVNGKRSVGEFDRGELWVVGPKAAVSSDVHQLGTVDLVPDDVGRCILAGEQLRHVIELRDRGDLRLRMFEIRACNEHHASAGARPRRSICAHGG